MRKQFAIIACPTCKAKKIVDTSSKTTHCNRCNKSLNLQKLKTLFESNSQEKARFVIGILNAEKDGKDEEFIKMNQK